MLIRQNILNPDDRLHHHRAGRHRHHRRTILHVCHYGGYRHGHRPCRLLPLPLLLAGRADRLRRDWQQGLYVLARARQAYLQPARRRRKLVSNNSNLKYRIIWTSACRGHVTLGPRDYQ